VGTNLKRNYIWGYANKKRLNTTAVDRWALELVPTWCPSLCRESWGGLVSTRRLLYRMRPEDNIRIHLKEMGWGKWIRIKLLRNVSNGFGFYSNTRKLLRIIISCISWPRKVQTAKVNYMACLFYDSENICTVRISMPISNLSPALTQAKPTLGVAINCRRGSKWRTSGTARATTRLNYVWGK
jgi:hypothetical protein